MKIFLLSFIQLIWYPFLLNSQSVSEKIAEKINQFEKDNQLQHAQFSLYIIDRNSADVIYDKNSNVGLAPASTQKIITSSTAYEILGKDFRYKTILGYTGHIYGNSLNGNLIITGSGDPTFGSWRWTETSEITILKQIIKSLKKLNISTYNNVIIRKGNWDDNPFSNSWIWEDIGNYYGAGALGFNWRENQYDLSLRSGSKIGDTVKVINSIPELYGITFSSKATSAEKGTGDNSYLYVPFNSQIISLRGTIPVNESRFTISGSIPEPDKQFVKTVINELAKEKITSKNGMVNIDEGPGTNIYSYYSPSFDSITFWFLQKSINLYGEALIRTIANHENKYANAENGIEIVKNFWQNKGIDKNEMNLVDGSGLSPLNRVTTHAEVMILKYACNQSWFPGFYKALPEYNGMKMKSGSIHAVKGFCGYHKSTNGKEYIFSFIINNYNGPASLLINKMYSILDELK